MSLARARAALKQMNRATEHLRLLAIFHYVAAGLAAFFSSSRCDRRDFHICFAAWHTKARRGVAARICWLDFCWLGIGPVPARDRNGYLYSHCRPMPFPSQSLLLRAGRGLHRMSLHSFRNNSRSLHDCCTLARVCKDVIFDRTIASVKIERSVSARC